MSTILEALEGGLAIQACELRLSTLASMWIQLFLGQDVAAGLIGRKKRLTSQRSVSLFLYVCWARAAACVGWVFVQWTCELAPWGEGRLNSPRS
jgi:hypothetical protein